MDGLGLRRSATVTGMRRWRRRTAASPLLEWQEEQAAPDDQRKGRRAKKSAASSNGYRTNGLADEFFDPGEFREIGHGRPLIL